MSYHLVGSFGDLHDVTGPKHHHLLLPEHETRRENTTGPHMGGELLKCQREFFRLVTVQFIAYRLILAELLSWIYPDSNLSHLMCVGWVYYKVFYEVFIKFREGAFGDEGVLAHPQSP